MNQIIHCQSHNSPAAMERILRTVRVRGFSLSNLQMSTDNNRLHIELAVAGERSVDMLVNQLAKLIDVQQVCTASESEPRLQYA